VRIGSSSITSIGGQVSWSTFSDGRFKQQVQEDVKGLEFIKLLRPVSYAVDVPAIDKYYAQFRKNSAETKDQSYIAPRRQYGFIAQEVEQAAAKSGFTFNGVDKPANEKALYGLRYSDFVVPIIKAMQEQQVIIEELQQKITALENRLMTAEKQK
jgi:trimeric autotransporter adhesin